MFNAVTFQAVYDTGVDMEFYQEQNYRGTFNGECSNMNQSPQQQADLRSDDYVSTCRKELCLLVLECHLDSYRGKRRIRDFRLRTKTELKASRSEARQYWVVTFVKKQDFLRRYYFPNFREGRTWGPPPMNSHVITIPKI